MKAWIFYLHLLYSNDIEGWAPIIMKAHIFDIYSFYMQLYVLVYTNNALARSHARVPTNHATDMAGPKWSA